MAKINKIEPKPKILSTVVTIQRETLIDEDMPDLYFLFNIAYLLILGTIFIVRIINPIKMITIKIVINLLSFFSHLIQNSNILLFLRIFQKKQFI